MRIRAMRLSRRTLLAAGASAAGALAGCHTTSPSPQFSQPGVARGDPNKVIGSPAFAQVAAGQQLPSSAVAGRMIPSGMTAGIASSHGMMAPGMAMPSYQTAMGSPQVLGSGGMVYPITYTSAGPVPMQVMPSQMMSPQMQMMPSQMVSPQMQMMPSQMMSPQMVSPQMQMMPSQMMPNQMMTAPGSPTTMMQGQVMYPQAMTVPTATTMPTISQAPTPTGQPTIMVVNGPNGQQYMIAEAVTTVPGPVPAPTPTPTPFAAGPATAAPAPASAPAPVIPAPEPTPTPPPPPTFSAPAPTFVPAPTMPPLPVPATLDSRIPDALPKSLSGNPPTGPVLPAVDTAGPSLGSFPAAPATTPTSGPKLPSGGRATDDYIPPAPVFVPAGR